MKAFLKENDYVWESNIEGHYSYGFQGKLLKNKIENFIRKQFSDFREIETPLILSKDVLKRSGHWDKFHDPIITTRKCNILRLDHLIEKNFDVEYTKLNFNEIKEYLKKIKLDDNDDELIIPEDTIKYRDLMMKLYSGKHEVALRPETATATFNSFNDMKRFNEYPIKVFQIGKSFRNEVSPRNGIIRGREFTQTELQYILPKEQKQSRYFEEQVKLNIKDNLVVDFNNNPLYFNLMKKTYKLFLDLGIPEDHIRLRRHDDNEKAFYALDAWDIEVNLNDLGWTEIAGIHDRGEHDLQHCDDKPHVLEIAIGIDRLFYCVLNTCYIKQTAAEGKNILRIPYSIAPVQVCILPLLTNKNELIQLSNAIYHKLKKICNCEMMIKQSIGKRYLKAAIKGIPYCVTIDFTSLEDNMVTLRDRDTEQQKRISIDQLDYELFKLFYF
jgi:glycyl-tRNA synthetase